MSAPAPKSALQRRSFYVAGRVGGGESDVQSVGAALVERGWDWSFDWTIGTPVAKPYLSHVSSNRPIATAMRDAAASSELVVLVWGDGILGALLETGVALGHLDEHRIVAVIGADARQSIFWCMDGVHVFTDEASFLAFIDDRAVTPGP